jgi:hypothetical protein
VNRFVVAAESPSVWSVTVRSHSEFGRRVAAASATTALAGVAAIHAVWATGSTWPTSSADELGDLVVGTRPMPGAIPCAAVAASLAVAAGATARSAGGGSGRVATASHMVATVTAGALLLRGLGGAVADVLNLGNPAAPFRRWNRLLYNPLCVGLGLLVAVSRSRPRARS